MCTCIALTQRGKFYFGRNLDLEYGFGEKAVCVPRSFPFRFAFAPAQERHYALTGTASLEGGVPLFADACNEKGVCMAGLYFPGNAHYFPAPEAGAHNLAPYELIPWILGACSSAAEAAELLRGVHLVAKPFSERLPLAPLHWMAADGEGCYVAEPTEEGMRVYENGARVLTNNPPFPYHMTRLNDFMALSPAQPQNSFAPELPLRPYGQGMGGIGLPGDASPSSRFVRAAFYAANSVCEEGEEVAQFFHVLGSVSMPRGGVRTPEGKNDVTRYACCMDTESGTVFYKTYGCGRPAAVRTVREGKELSVFSLPEREDVLYLN